MAAHAIFHNGSLKMVIVGRPKHALEKAKKLKAAHAKSLKLLPEGDLYHQVHKWHVLTVACEVYQD